MNKHKKKKISWKIHQNALFMLVRQIQNTVSCPPLHPPFLSKTPSKTPLDPCQSLTKASSQTVTGHNMVNHSVKVVSNWGAISQKKTWNAGFPPKFTKNPQTSELNLLENLKMSGSPFDLCFEFWVYGISVSFRNLLAEYLKKSVVSWLLHKFDSQKQHKKQGVTPW